jgi:hypothetical protein
MIYGAENNTEHVPYKPEMTLMSIAASFLICFILRHSADVINLARCTEGRVIQN